jgi:hypothetical protein
MRWLAALLLLSACGSKNDEEAGGGASPAALEGLDEAAGTLNPAQLEARAAAAIGVIATDPRFSEIRGGPMNAVCGKVDTKLPNGKYSGFKPFVVTPEGVAVISATPGILFNDPADPFPDLYIRWCATPEEMQTIGPMIARNAEVPPPPVEVPPETIDPVPQGNWGVVPGAAPPPPPPPAPKVAEAPAAAAKEKAPPPPPAVNRQPGDEDSFMKSVIKPGEPKAGN